MIVLAAVATAEAATDAIARPCVKGKRNDGSPAPLAPARKNLGNESASHIRSRAQTGRVVRRFSHVAPRPQHVRVCGFGGDAAGEEGLRIVVGLEALSSGRVGRFFSRDLRGGDSVS